MREKLISNFSNYLTPKKSKMKLHNKLSVSPDDEDGGSPDKLREQVLYYKGQIPMLKSVLDQKQRIYNERRRTQTRQASNPLLLSQPIKYNKFEMEGKEEDLKSFTNNNTIQDNINDNEKELKSLKKNKHRMSANILHWNKADRIKIDKNPNNDKDSKKTISQIIPQSRISFMYNRNAYDYGDKEATIIKKVPLKNLFVLDKEELLKNPNEDLELVKSAFKKQAK